MNVPTSLDVQAFPKDAASLQVQPRGHPSPQKALRERQYEGCGTEGGFMEPSRGDVGLPGTLVGQGD